jgi:type II secretory pathway component PulM
MAEATLELILTEIVKLNSEVREIRSEVREIRSEARDTKLQTEKKFDSLDTQMNQHGTELHALSGLVHAGFAQVGTELSRIQKLAEKTSAETAKLTVRVTRIEEHLHISSN